MADTNFLDSIIGFFSPRAALARAGQRAALANIRNYEAASGGRRTKNWRTSQGSQNNIGNYQIKTLRDRSRDLVRNNPLAAKSIRTIATSVVGTGIRPSIPNKRPAQRKTKKAWVSWAETRDCDWFGKQNIYGIQALVIRGLAESGEMLILKRRVKTKSGIPIQLQVLEPEFLDESKDTYRVSGQEYISGGISFDKVGKIKGYWIYDSHPGEYGMTKSSFWPADDVIHIFDVLRAGQIRGVPFGTASFLTLRDLDEYADAQLVKQKVSACLAVIVQDSSETFSARSDSEEFPNKIEPGAIMTTGPGQGVSVVNPPSVDGYSEFTRSVKHDVSAGYGVTYASMTNDLSQVNYSSNRMGWIDFLMFVEHLQELVMAPQFLNPIWQWFLDAGMLSDLKLDNTVTCTWTPPKRYFVDPAKEGKAIVDMMRGGMVSWQESVRQAGYDPDDVREELAADKKMWDDLGLNPYSDPRFDIGRKNDAAVAARSER